MLTGKITQLRRVTEGDTELMFQWENMPEFWHVSMQSGPVSREEIAEFIRSSGNLVSMGQERWLISDHEETELGFLDLFNYNPHTKCAGVGILIADTKHRSKGFAGDALRCIEDYCFQQRVLREMECLIHEDNIASLELFRKLGYRPAGIQLFKGKNALVFRKKL